MKLANNKSYGEALVKYKKAKRCAPQNPDLGYLMGVAFEGQGQPDQALDAYRQCTSGNYVTQASQHVKRLEGKKKKSKP